MYKLLEGMQGIKSVKQALAILFIICKVHVMSQSKIIMVWPLNFVTGMLCGPPLTAFLPFLSIVRETEFALL